MITSSITAVLQATKHPSAPSWWPRIRRIVGNCPRSLPKSLAFTNYLLPVLVLCALTQRVLAQVEIPAEYISVGNFFGDANERIDAAIAAAMATDHKTVFFPNGTYALREGLQLDQGANTELHLVGESRDGVLLVPDVAYLEANYNGGDWQAGGARLAHMINLSRGSVFESVDVSIQNMTVDMRSQLVLGETPTYNVVGHGVRVGQGWEEGQFTVNHVTIRNTGSYGVGVQDRDGHPKNNVTLTNLHIERTGSDGIDTKEASGDGNRNLVIRNVNINEVGFLDTGAAPAIDIRYRDAVIENVNLVSQASRSTLPGQTSSTTGIVFRPYNEGDAGIVGATVSNVYIRGFNNGISVGASDITPHANIDISDFRIQGQQNAGIGFSGTNHSGHTVSDGFVDPAFGGAAVNAGGQATVTNVAASRWDPALTPLTDTTFEGDVSLAGQTYSPAWEGIVGSERVSLNPTAGPGPFVFDVGDTGVMQIDFDGVYNAMDRLVVDGTLNLDGELRINLIDDAPTAGRAFQVFEADSITGSFDTLTLPPLGPGLFWDTDSLGIDGTLTLLQANSLTLGDSNTSYDASSADDNPPLDAGFEADLLTTYNPSWALLGLDQTGRNDVRAMTFEFDPLAPESLDSAWIEARVLGESGYENDTMVLDAAGNNRSLASLEGFTTDGGWMTVRYELDATEFDLLSDGLLNLAFLDDTRVDWVSLSWVLTENPPTGVPGDFNNDGVVDAVDYSVWRDNLGAENESALNGNGSGSGGVDADDYDLWRQNFGVASADVASALAGVPEPSANLLATLGLLAFGRLPARRRIEVARTTNPPRHASFEFPGHSEHGKQLSKGDLVGPTSLGTITRTATATLLACCLGHLSAGSTFAGNSIDAPIEVAVSSEGVDIAEGGKPVLRYQLAETSLEGRFPRSNYIHPLYDLDGVVLTEDFPSDHPWHRGVFWTWHQVLIGEKRIGDPWICEDFRWEVARVESTPLDDRSHSVRVTLHWQSPAWRPAGVMTPFAEETVGLRVYPTSDGRRVIDFDIRLHALTPDLRIGGSKNAKGYGGFSLRIKNPLDLLFRGDQGPVQSTRTAVHAGRWLDICHRDKGVHDHVLVLTHKDHPGAVTPWILRNHTRAMQNVVYPGRQAVPVSDDPESPLSLRYRLIIHRGDVTTERIEAWQADYDAGAI